MSIRREYSGLRLLAVATFVLLLGACSGMRMPGSQSARQDSAPASSTKLSGAQEVPPVSTGASGTSTIRVASDRSVSGAVNFSGMTATAAHIHEGAAGANGPVIVPLTKTSDTSFAVPANAKLTDAQYESYKAGKLYVNVHSAAHPGGEIRAQLNAK